MLLSAILGLGAAGPPWLAAADRAGAGAGAPRARLGRLARAAFSEPEAARAIGARYLASHPEAANEALDLADRLLAGRPAGPAQLRRLLAACRDEDIRRRAFVIVDGWILPKAEAQACALTTLL